MQVLLIEDDVRLGAHIQKALRELGHVVDHEIDGKAGLLTASSELYDAIILDRTLPRVDGLKILQTLRATGDRTPIIILSALSAVEEKVAGLRAGGDDYLAKPFAISELVARLEVLQRRGPIENRIVELTAGTLVLDLAAHSLHKNGVAIELTPREFRILEYLMRHVGHVVTRSMLLEAVWEYSFDPQTNVVDQYIRRIRQKLDPQNGEAYIRTVRGAGYSFKEFR